MSDGPPSMLMLDSPCPGEDAVLAFIGHELTSSEAAEIQQHLASCIACRRLVSELAQDRSNPAVAATWNNAAVASDAAPTASRHYRNGLTLARGTTISRYIIVSLLGRGGMGVVYRAYDPDLNRQVALKLVALGDLSDSTRDQARQRLLREAQALAKLSHPNVVVVHDVGTVGDDVFIAMELVEGDTLRAWLRQQPRTPREILRVFRLAGEGLAAAHKVGVIHRDFKPDNVMVGTDGRVRVLDFGLARVATSTRPSRPSLASLVVGSNARSSASSQELTHAGTVLGTPAYMSPEQDAGLEAGASSDQFSFCVALYEALFGRNPHVGETYLELANSRASGDVIPPPKLNGVTSRIRRAVLVGLRPVSADRHRNLDDLISELEVRRWASRRWIVTAASAVLLIGISATWAIARRTAAPAASCGFVAEEAAKIWNPTRRDGLIAMLTRSAPHEATAIARISESYDRWASDWVKERTRVCEAASRGGSKEHKNADELQCLERALSHVDASLLVFNSSDLPALPRIDEIARQLGSPAECHDAVSTEPTEADKQAAAPLIAEIMRVRGALRAGKLDEALDLAKLALDHARAADIKGAIGYALQTLAEAQAAHADLAEARKTYREAAIAWSEAHVDGSVVDAWLGFIRISLQDRKVNDDVRAAMFDAKLAAARLSADDDHHPMLAFVFGSIDVLEGKVDDGIAYLQHSLEGWNRLGAAKFAGEIAQAQNSIGMAYTLRGDWGAARTNLMSAWDAMNRIYGPRQPAISAVKRNLSSLELRQGHFEEAERFAVEAIELASTTGPKGQWVGDTELQLASVDVAWERCDQAKPHLAIARSVIESVRGADSPLLAVVDMLEGRCLIARDPHGAIKRLLRAQATATAQVSQIDALPEIDFALAQAIARAGDDHDHALALAQTARTAFVKVGAGTALRVQAVDAWLATHAK